MWDSFVRDKSIDTIMNDKGLAKIGDGLVNFCYSLAKSAVLGEATGEKVRDSVLAHAIRATPVYSQIGRRTDVGDAADAFEAIMAYLWLTKTISIEEIVNLLVQNLEIDSKTSRKKENSIAACAFQIVLEKYMKILPT
jgi:23S rRNA maturation mini-RNase III